MFLVFFSLLCVIFSFWIFFPNLFLLGIALMWTICGKVYNGITDDDTHDDILNLSIVDLLWCWGLVVGRTRTSGAFLVLPLCTLPLLFLSL